MNFEKKNDTKMDFIIYFYYPHLRVSFYRANNEHNTFVH